MTPKCRTGSIHQTASAAFCLRFQPIIMQLALVPCPSLAAGDLCVETVEKPRLHGRDNFQHVEHEGHEERN